MGTQQGASRPLKYHCQGSLGSTGGSCVCFSGSFPPLPPPASRLASYDLPLDLPHQSSAPCPSIPSAGTDPIVQASLGSIHLRLPIVVPVPRVDRHHPIWLLTDESTAYAIGGWSRLCHCNLCVSEAAKETPRSLDCLPSKLDRPSALTSATARQPTTSSTT